MSSILLNVQILTNVATPLVVALLCLHAYQRRISKDDLLLWAAAHLALALTFVSVAIAPPQGDPADLHAAWQSALFLYFCTSGLILAGVLAAETPRIDARGGLLVSLAVAAAMLAMGAVHPGLMMYVSLPLNVLAYLAAALILIWRRRSVAHVIAGAVLLLRAANGVTFIATVINTGVYALPGITSTLSVFLNFLTGISLLAIAMENSWARLRTALEEARDARQETDIIFDLAPVSILRKNAALRVLRANRYALDMAQKFGHFLTKADGQRSGDIMPNGGAAEMEQLDRQVLRNPAAGMVEKEVVVDRADGGHMILLVRKTATMDPAGTATGLVSAALDITHLKEVESRLREQIVLAEQASKAKSDFLAHMSHELRTPLNGISGFADLLAAGYAGPLTPRQQEYVDGIVAANRHMLGLVSDILDLARRDAGKLELARSATDVGALLDIVVATAAPAAAARGVTLHWTPTPATAFADRPVLLQAVWNLVDNAIRFNRPAGAVQITLAQDGERVRITIADTGEGMTPAQIAASGDPFQRGNPMQARLGGGAGLGLAISRSLVELHGGELAIASEIGKGTTVTLVL